MGETLLVHFVRASASIIAQINTIASWRRIYIIYYISVWEAMRIENRGPRAEGRVGSVWLIDNPISASRL